MYKKIIYFLNHHQQQQQTHKNTKTVYGGPMFPVTIRWHYESYLL